MLYLRFNAIEIISHGNPAVSWIPASPFEVVLAIGCPPFCSAPSPLLGIPPYSTTGEGRHSWLSVILASQRHYFLPKTSWKLCALLVA